MWDTGLGRLRIAVIPDLPIGADDFAPTGFGEFLDHLEREHDEIILLGDVFECHFPVLPWRALAEYDRLDRFHRDITHRFRSAKNTILLGNHDVGMRRARNIPSRTARGRPGYRILLSHGQKNESAFRGSLKARLVELYMWLVYRLKRVGLPGATTINTGDCVRRRMYASLDHERRECRLLEFPGRHVATERED